MNRSVNFFAVFSAILLLSFQSFSQEVTIEDLAKNPAQYDGELVTVTGFVKQYTPGNAQSTSFYILQGDYGGIVKVNTADAAPETFKKYKVTGIAYFDPKTVTVFISEKEKEIVGNDKTTVYITSTSSDPTSTAPIPVTITFSNSVTGFDANDINVSNGTVVNFEGTGAIYTADISPSGSGIVTISIAANSTSAGNEASNRLSVEYGIGLDSTTILIIGLGVVLFILIVVFFTRRKKAEEPSFEQMHDTGKHSSYEKSGEIDAPDLIAGEDDFKTIKIERPSDPKTLVFIPGTLTITSGADSGKSFRIVGFPTPNGSIVTLGSKMPEGERKYSHIHLTEKTVSREQAEIISKNGKLQVKNLSNTNYTVVDGVELAPGQLADLHPNSTIRTGEVEFKYTM